MPKSESKGASTEKRTDSVDKKAYTFEALSAHYAAEGYSKKDIKQYWNDCAIVKQKTKFVPKKEPGADEATSASDKAPLRKPAAADDVLEKLKACLVVPVIKLDDAAHAAPLCKALKDGGINVAEITFRTACAADAMREVSKNVEGVCLGAGTVLKVAQVDVAIEAGADFIVSPGFDPQVARRCQKRGILYLPGVVTPTEVMMVTSKFGLKTLKFFPASNFGGAGTLKSYSAVFQDVSFMPTGGVTEANIRDFVSLPNVIAAGGSWMVADAAIKSAASSGDWSSVTAAARNASDAAHARSE